MFKKIEQTVLKATLQKRLLFPLGSEMQKIAMNVKINVLLVNCINFAVNNNNNFISILVKSLYTVNGTKNQNPIYKVNF